MMQLREDELIASREAVAALADELRLGRGALTLVPHEDPDGAQRAQGREWLRGLEGGQRDSLHRALRVLAQPAQAGLLHYTIGDEMVARASLAWGEDPDDPLVIAADDGAGCLLRWRHCGWLPSLLGDVLRQDELIAADEVVGVPLSPAALLTLLAIAEAHRQGRLLAQLAHLENPTVFTEEDVAAYLRDHVDAYDFRRPLLFLDRLLPVPMAELQLWDQREESFEQLERAGLIRRQPAAPGQDGSGEELWELTAAGAQVEMGLWYGIAKAGIRISRPLAGGGTGHEVVLLVRAPNRLWLFDLASREGIVSTLDGPALADALGDLLTVRAADATRALHVQQSPAAPRVAAITCSSCGASVAADKKFCGDCGTPVGQPAAPAPSATPAAPATATAACAQCGADLATGARFCRECGTPTAPPATSAAPGAPAASPSCAQCGTPRSPGAKFCRGCGRAY